MACKQWNQLPADGFHWTGNSYDNTGELSATSWRHVKFIEQFPQQDAGACSVRRAALPLDVVARSAPTQGRWLMMSDVCKHCVTAPCQQACPTGAIIHNEFENVYIQPDICNGCAYCIAACPFGVITRSQLRRPCAQVHALLRPPDGRPGPGLRQGLPDGSRSSSARSTSCASGPASASRSCTGAACRRAYLYGDAPDRDLLRAELVLPPGRSPLGVRPAGEAVQPVAAHEGGLRPRRSSAGWPRSPCCSRVFLLLGH